MFSLSCISADALQPLKRLLNNYKEDGVQISATYLLQLVESRGWTCTSLFQITHYATSAVHMVALLETGHFICDCMMVTNLGLPCRHFYAVLKLSNSPTHFHLGLLNRRCVKQVLPSSLRTSSVSTQMAHQSRSRYLADSNCEDWSQ